MLSTGWKDGKVAIFITEGEKQSRIELGVDDGERLALSLLGAVAYARMVEHVEPGVAAAMQVASGKLCAGMCEKDGVKH